MSHPARSTAPVLASPTAAMDGGGGRSGTQAPAGTTTRAGTTTTGKREGQGTRWVRGRAGHGPPRSRSRPRRTRPRVAFRRGSPPALRRHRERADPPQRGNSPYRPSGPRTDGGPGRHRRRRRETSRRQSGGPGRRRATRPPGSGRRPSSGRAPPGARKPGTRGTGTRKPGTRGTGTPATGTPATGTLATGPRGTGSGLTLGTRPETDGGRGTTGGSLIRDQPILIRRWRTARRSRRPGGAPTRKAFARGVPITQRIRRSPARRQPQTRGLLSILTQNGPRKG